MLIRFNVSNFLSFNEETEFNMLAVNSLKTHAKHVYTIKKGINLLKASAIYGANGAGKSNLIVAIYALKKIIEQGSISSPSSIKEHKFRFKAENVRKPTTLEAEFSRKGKIYTYGISYNDGIVIEEWLYNSGSSNPKMIFERKYSFEKKHSIINMDSKYLKTKRSKMLISLIEENLLKKDELLISKNENLKIKEIDSLNWFKECLEIIYPDSRVQSFAGKLYVNTQFKEFAEKFLKTLDVGVDSLSFKNESLDKYLSNNGGMKKDDIEDLKEFLDKGGVTQLSPYDSSIVAVKEKGKYITKNLIAQHMVKGNQTPIEIYEESDGTRRLMDFIPMLHSLLNEEKVYVIDEIDRSLHPAMIHSIISKIMNDDSIKGQLIFTTHEASLLNCKIFRSDEIWFAEKEQEYQSSKLYTLHSFKPRNDLDIEKGYLNGRFGAIPFLTKLDDLNWD